LFLPVPAFPETTVEDEKPEVTPQRKTERETATAGLAGGRSLCVSERERENVAETGNKVASETGTGRKSNSGRNDFRKEVDERDCEEQSERE
jgi:hypothetical protein